MPEPTQTDDDPRQRLLAFMKAQGWNQAQAAKEFDCSPAFVSMIVRGRKYPGRRLANIIESATAQWEKGPIRATDWDAAQDAERETAA